MLRTTHIHAKIMPKQNKNECCEKCEVILVELGVSDPFCKNPHCFCHRSEPTNEKAVFGAESLACGSTTVISTPSWSDEFDKMWAEDDEPRLRNFAKAFISKVRQEAVEEYREKLVGKIKEERVDENFNSGWHRENAKGYNQALDDILTKLNHEEE